jgi:hypothetical protein
MASAAAPTPDDPTPAPPSNIDGLTGPLPRLLTSEMVDILQELRQSDISSHTDAEARTALANSQRLAERILRAVEPDDVNIDREIQHEISVLTAERDAARREASVHNERVATLSAQLTQALLNGAPNNNGGDGKSFSDIFKFDGSDPKLIRSWISHLRIKLAGQPRQYPTEQSQLQYAFNRLSGAAFNQVRSYLQEDTGIINFQTLNEFLENIKAVYDDPDRARTARKELNKLTMGPEFPTFPLYLAEFRRLVGDMDLNDSAQMFELEKGLTTDLRNALIMRGGITTLAEMVAGCREIDAAMRALQAEQVTVKTSNPPRPAQAPRAPAPPAPAPRPAAPRPAATPAPASPAHPTDSNSGSYGAAPMNLSASEKQQRRAGRMARGECTYCGTLGHFRADCALRLAKEARDLRIAQLGFAEPVPAPATPAPASGNVQSPTA